MKEIYCDPTKRHDFVYLFDVTNGNPNGDPDAGNLPRVDPETMHGIVTDVCVKRKVRDYVAGVLQRPIFIQSETALNTLYGRALASARDDKGNSVGRPIPLNLAEDKNLKGLLENEAFAEWLENLDDEEMLFEPAESVLTYLGAARSRNEFAKLLQGDEDVEPGLKRSLGVLAKSLSDAARSVPKLKREARGIVKNDLVKKYFDIRMFGAVLTAGTNAGQVRGPMQLTFAQSIDPIQPRDIPITRVAITKPSDLLRKQTEMGRKAIVPYGLYRLHGFYSPYLGRRRKDDGAWEAVVSESDLGDFWEALRKMFEFDRSAARGEMIVRGLYVFTHEDEKGNAPSHKLFDLISVKPCGEKPPRRFDDYRDGITVPEAGSIEGYPGVTLSRVVSELAATANADD